MQSSDSKQDIQLTTSLIVMLSVACGIAVASLYYSHPLLPLFADSFAVNSNQIGALPTLTQAGYALGLLLLVPLGDKFDRRNLIVVKGIALSAALFLTASSGGLTLLLIASLVVGITASMAQDIIPTAAYLADPKQRGHTVGLVMTGLLSGILLSRVISGLLGEWIGWRGVYWVAAVAIFIASVLIWRLLPSIKPQSHLSAMQIYRSMWQLFKTQPAIQKAAVAQGLLNAGFSAFWTTMALMLSQQFDFGSSIAGLFGLAGAAGAIAAPSIGKMADKLGAKKLVWAGALLATLSFGLMLVPASSMSAPLYLTLLVVLTILFDLGVQLALVSHQTIIYNTVPDAMARGNALLLVGLFIGMTLGSSIASQLFAAFGWQGVVSFALLVSFVALLIRMLPDKLTSTELQRDV